MNDSGSVMHLKGYENEVYMWIEHGSSVMLKAITSHGDPVELTSDNARELGKMLIKAAERLDPMT